MAIRHRDDTKLRKLLSQECARIMANEGVKDFMLAKQKAAARLGISNKALLPTNLEVEQSLMEYQRLFQSEQQSVCLRNLRQTAVEAMDFLARFQPRLVGPVLAGTANSHTSINLHVFADTSEEIMLFLMEHQIPFETSERRLKLSHSNYAWFPTFSFIADLNTIDLTVFQRGSEREVPRSPVDGGPMRRANITEVKKLLYTATTSPTSSESD